MVQGQPIKKEKKKKMGMLYKEEEGWFFLDDILEEHGPYDEKDDAIVALKQIIGDFSRRG